MPTWSTPTIHVVGGRRRSSSTAGGTWAPTTSRLARKSGSSRASGRYPGSDAHRRHGLVYLTAAHGPGQPVFAIRETARHQPGADTTTNAHIAWSYPRDGACMISPVLYRGLLYVSKNNGTFSVFDAVTGRRRIRSGWATARRDSPRRSWPPTARCFHQRRWRRLCGEGGPHLRADVEEPARRLRDGGPQSPTARFTSGRAGGHRGQIGPRSGGPRVSMALRRLRSRPGLQTRPRRRFVPPSPARSNS